MSATGERDPDRHHGHLPAHGREVIGFMTPSGRETLQRPLPEGKFLVVGISAGGNSYGILSIPNAPAGP